MVLSRAIWVCDNAALHIRLIVDVVHLCAYVQIAARLKCHECVMRCIVVAEDQKLSSNSWFGGSRQTMSRSGYTSENRLNHMVSSTSQLVNSHSMHVEVRGYQAVSVSSQDSGSVRISSVALTSEVSRLSSV